MSIKKLLSTALSTALVLSSLVIPVSVSAEVTASGTCGAVGNEDKVTWSYDDSTKTLTISGTGAMADYYGEWEADWYFEGGGTEDTTKIVVGDGITHIGNYTFSGFTKVSSIEIGDSVTSIGEHAFYECGAHIDANLTSITVPDSVKSIGSCAFYACGTRYGSTPTLKNIYMGSGIQTIGDEAFKLISDNAIIYYSGNNEGILTALKATAAKAVITQKEVVNPTSEDNKPAFVSNAGIEKDGGATGFVSDITNNKTGEAQVINSITWAVTSKGVTKSHTETYSEPMTVSGDFYITFIVSGLYDPDATVVTTIN